MSNTLKLAAALGLVGFLAACGGSAPTEEVVFVDPAPVAAQPVFTGKYN